jgi:hypothetical protein
MDCYRFIYYCCASFHGVITLQHAAWIIRSCAIYAILTCTSNIIQSACCEKVQHQQLAMARCTWPGARWLYAALLYDNAIFGARGKHVAARTRSEQTSHTS